MVKAGLFFLPLLAWARRNVDTTSKVRASFDGGPTSRGRSAMARQGGHRRAIARQAGAGPATNENPQALNPAPRDSRRFRDWEIVFGQSINASNPWGKARRAPACAHVASRSRCGGRSVSISTRTSRALPRATAGSQPAWAVSVAVTIQPDEIAPPAPAPVRRMVAAARRRGRVCPRASKKFAGRRSVLMRNPALECKSP